MQSNKVLLNTSQELIWATTKMEFDRDEASLFLKMGHFMKVIGKMITCQDMEG